MVHFNWTQLISVIGHHYVHVATLLVGAIVLLVLGFFARISIGTGVAAITPAKTFGLKAAFEAIIDFIVSVSDLVIGEEGRGYVPMFSSIFLFIFVNNFLGLLPGMTPATDNINTTLALGIFVFFIYNYYGFREHGVAYLKQFLGPLLLLAPLMVIIEVISHLVRPMSLGLRLQGNMMGDHTVLGLFLDLAPYYGLPIIFYGLGLFVCFMQAFVFTMLSMIYVSMAISHDH